MSLNTQHTTNTNYNKHNFCDVPRSVKIKHHPLSVRGDQGSSVVIHGQSVAIRYHPMSVREDQSSCRSVKINHHVAISDRPLSVREGQASSFVSLHQGMRLPDKQTRYRQARQARQQGRSQSFWIWVLRSTVSVPSYCPQQNTLTLKLARLACLEAGVFFLRSSLQPRSVALRFLRLNTVNP